MSTDKTNHQSGFDHSSTDESITRRELEIRLHLKELANTHLRRRIARLERAHGFALLEEKPRAKSRIVALNEELTAIVEANDE